METNSQISQNQENIIPSPEIKESPELIKAELNQKTNSINNLRLVIGFLFMIVLFGLGFYFLNIPKTNNSEEVTSIENKNKTEISDIQKAPTQVVLENESGTISKKFLPYPEENGNFTKITLNNVKGFEDITEEDKPNEIKISNGKVNFVARDFYTSEQYFILQNKIFNENLNETLYVSDVDSSYNAYKYTIHFSNKVSDTEYCGPVEILRTEHPCMRDAYLTYKDDEISLDSITFMYCYFDDNNEENRTQCEDIAKNLNIERI